MTRTASESYVIALAAGGTGGHIFPAEALAEELRRAGHQPVLFTDERYHHYHPSQDDIPCPYYIVSAESPRGSLLSRLKGWLQLARGTWQSTRLFRQLQVQVVVGFGGYPSFPSLMAARILRLPIVLHEQNAILGRINRFMVPHVHTLATSFPALSNLPAGLKTTITHTGNPVRISIRAIRDVPYPELLEEGILRILVIGGSQGASVFSEVIPEAIRLLPAALRNRIRIDQQCRAADIDKVRELYKHMMISADLASFFTDIPARIASSHLVISRAGASSLAEITVSGRPAILVPYPHAEGKHQHHNARSLEDAKGGWVIDQQEFTPKNLATRLEAFLNAPSMLTEAAQHAKHIGVPYAAERLAHVVTQTIA